MLASVHELFSPLPGFFKSCIGLPQFDLALALDPFDRAVQCAVLDVRTRLKLTPLGFIPETKKEYLRPATAVTRDLYGGCGVFSWGGGDLGCL